MIGVIGGREREIGAIERCLDLLDSGPAILLFEGEAGIGKTTLMRGAIKAAEDREILVLTCSGTPSEGRLSYSALSDLLEPVQPEAFESLPDLQRTAVDVALVRAPSPDGTDEADRRAVSAAAVSILGWLAEQGPLVLAIDDLQWIDVPSRRVIEFCARRLPTGCGLIASRRMAGGGPPAPRLEGLNDPARVDARFVAPLAASDLRRIVRERTEVRLERGVLNRILEIAGGNPFYALELARWAPAENGAKTLTLPPSLGDIVDARTEGLDPRVLEGLLAISTMAHPTVTELEHLLGSGIADDLAEAERRGLIEIGADEVRFSHPLLAEGIYARESSGAKRRIHKQLSSIATDVEDRARHLAAARMIPEALGALEEAAGHLRARGAPDGAAEMLELALDLGGEPRLMVAAAEYHFDAGDTRTAVGMLEEAISLLAPGRRRAEALLLLGEIRCKDDSFPDANTLLQRAQSEAEDDERLLLMIDLRLAFTLYNLGLMPKASEAGHSALSRAEKLGDDALLAQALAVVVIVDFSLGLGLDESALRRALQLADPSHRTGVELMPAQIAMFVYLWSGDFERSRVHQESVWTYYLERGEEQALAWSSFTRVLLESWSGDADSTAAAAAEANERLRVLETVTADALALVARAVTEAYAGDVEAAREACEQSLVMFDRSGWKTWSWFPRMILGALELSQGNHHASVSAVEPLIALIAADEQPDPAPGGILFAGDAAEALIALGRREEAETIILKLEHRGEALERRWAIAVGARCRGLLDAASGDLPAAESSLKKAMETHDELEMPVEEARSLLALGRILRLQRRRREAADALGQAKAILDGLGEAAWANAVDREIACLGLRPGSPDELTPAEGRVAALAAKGLTNREVADSLVVSHKTVEAHLARAYRKLGIRSRAELGAQLGR